MKTKINTNLKRAIAAITAATVSGAASAGELAAAVTDGMDKAELTLIGVGVLTLVGIVVLIKKSGRAAGG